MGRLEYSNQVSPKNKSTRANVFVGTVIDVITSEESKGIYDLGFGEGETRNLTDIGYAKIRKLSDLTSAVNELSYFPPYDYTNIDFQMWRPVHPHMSIAPPWAKMAIVDDTFEVSSREERVQN